MLLQTLLQYKDKIINLKYKVLTFRDSKFSYLIDKNQLKLNQNIFSDEKLFLKFIKLQRAVLELSPDVLNIINENHGLPFGYSLIIGFTTHCYNDQCIKLDNILLDGSNNKIQYLSTYVYCINSDLIKNIISTDYDFGIDYNLTPKMEYNIKKYITKEIIVPIENNQSLVLSKNIKFKQLFLESLINKKPFEF